MVSRRPTPDRREDEERIRQRAYEIWEREGRPHGREEDHWAQAKEEVAAELEYPETLQSNPARRRSTARRSEPVEPVISPESQAEPIGPTEEEEEQPIPAARTGTGAATGTKMKEVEPGQRSGSSHPAKPKTRPEKSRRSTAPGPGKG